MSPQNLLICCKNIENKMGRTKSIKWGKRKIDIDILYFSEIIVQEKDLTIPHPLIQFVVLKVVFWFVGFYQCQCVYL